MGCQEAVDSKRVMGLAQKLALTRTKDQHQVVFVGTHGAGGLRMKSHSLKVTLLSWLAKAGAD
eukprot:3793344-Amphidinium_carterae.1